MRNPSGRILYGALCLCIAAFVSCSDDPTGPGDGDGTPSQWPPPDPLVIEAEGLPAMPIPPDNPTTVQGVALGRELFYDPILSGDSTQSCASCHQFGRGFSDDERFSIGIDGIAGGRNAPTIINPGWLPVAFWDGRAASLEDQALQPVENVIEMHETWPNVEAKLQRHPDYPDKFGRAFGTDLVTKELVVKAIAQFERTFISNDSKYDRFLRGEVQLTQSELNGLNLFFTETGDCFHCHGNALGTDNAFHNIGLDSTLFAEGVDLGLGEITGNPTDFLKFKTPTLRNVEVTGPYMHDGRFATLEEVVGHYNSGGFGTDTVDPLIRVGIGLGLTQQQVDDLVAFLKTLTDDSFLNNPSLSNPFE